MTDIFIFYVLTFIDLTAAAIIFAGALGERMRLYPTWHKIGLITASLGLVAQAMRNIMFLHTGVSPNDADQPFWVLKDLGIAIIGYFYLARGIMHYKESRKQIVEPKLKPATRKAHHGKEMDSRSYTKTRFAAKSAGGQKRSKNPNQKAGRGSQKTR